MNTFKWISRLIAILLLAQLGGLAVAQERITYIHTDALGSPIAASDEDGNFIWRESYQPYGKRLRLQKGSDRPWYTGKYEEDIGLVYYGKRWYNPEIGRFYSVDPARFDENNIHSFNRYAYANNNPYKFVDPDGAVPILPILLWIGAELANLGFEAHDNQANPCSDCVRSSGFGVPGPPAGVIGNRIARNSTSLIPNNLATRGTLKQFGHSVDDLSSAASQPFKNTGLTRAAHALDKHAAGQRSTGTFPPLSGNVAARNKQAQQIVDDILANPKSEFKMLGRGGMQVRSPGGQGIRFDKDGSFSSFID